MIWKIKIFGALCFLLLSCNFSAKIKAIEAVSTEKENKYHSTKHIIEAKELLSIHGQKNIKIVDFRKKETYENGHIEGAINIWRTDVEDSTYPFGGMMASKEQIEVLFSQLGIENGDVLVVYDDRGSCDAARLWWVLKNYNFHAVKILNGGIQAWKTAKGSISNSTPKTESSNFSLSENSPMETYIDKEEVLQIIEGHGNEIIIDTRTVDEYSGKRQKKGASGGGRIPQSQLLDWAESIDYDNTKKFKSFKELQAIYAKFGAAKDDPIITYCHTGVRSAHTTFVLTELLGYKNVRNYDGSWTEWSYFKDYPVKKDSITTIFQ